MHCNEVDLIRAPLKKKNPVREFVSGAGSGLLDRCGVCWRVVFDNMHNSASFMSVLINNNSHY